MKKLFFSETFHVLTVAILGLVGIFLYFLTLATMY
jgi:hypothetical protein